MNCPECLSPEPMECQEANEEKGLAHTKDRGTIVGANYFCTECQAYWHWDRVEGLMLMQEGDSAIPRMINEQLARSR